MKTNPQNTCKQQPTQTARQLSKTPTKTLRQERQWINKDPTNKETNNQTNKQANTHTNKTANKPPNKKSEWTKTHKHSTNKQRKLENQQVFSCSSALLPFILLPTLLFSTSSLFLFLSLLSVSLSLSPSNLFFPLFSFLSCFLLFYFLFSQIWLHFRLSMSYVCSFSEFTLHHVFRFALEKINFVMPKWSQLNSHLNIHFQISPKHIISDVCRAGWFSGLWPIICISECWSLNFNVY